LSVEIKTTSARAGAITEDLGAYLDHLPLFAEAFRAPGFTDKQTLTAAFAAWIERGGELWLDPGRLYDLGVVSESPYIVFQLVGLRNAVLRGNGATLQVETAEDADYVILYCYDYINLAIHDLHGIDVNDPGVGLAGAKLIVADGDGGVCDNLRLYGCSAENIQAFLGAQGTAAGAKRVSGIYIEPSCWTRNVFYSLSCVNNGDNISGGYTAFNPHRAYFPYGVTDHDLAVRVVSDGTGTGADACFLIKRYERNTSNLRLRITLFGNLNNIGNVVAIENHNGDGASSVIDGIDLTINAQGVTVHPGPFVRLRSFPVSPGAENVGDNGGAGFPHQIRNLSVRGNLGTSSLPRIKANYVPATPGTITLDPALAGLSATRTVDAPGWIIKTAPDRAVFEQFGDLTAATLAIPIPAYNSHDWGLKLSIYAERKGTNADGAGSKMHFFEIFVAGYSNASGAFNVGVIDVDYAYELAVNSSNLTVAVTGLTNKLILTWTGSDYAFAINPTAYARVEVAWLSRPAAL
jgi:hypothetical protein